MNLVSAENMKTFIYVIYINGFIYALQKVQAKKFIKRFKVLFKFFLPESAPIKTTEEKKVLQ